MVIIIVMETSTMEGDPPRNWAKCRRTNYQGRKQQHFRSSWSVSATETTRIPRLLVWKTSWASWRQHGNCGDVGDHPKFVPATMVSYWCHWCGWNHMDNDAKSCCFDEITILVNKKRQTILKTSFLVKRDVWPMFFWFDGQKGFSPKLRNQSSLDPWISDE